MNENSITVNRFIVYAKSNGAIVNYENPTLNTSFAYLP